MLQLSAPGTPCIRQERITMNSRDFPSTSFADRRFRDHLATDSVRVKRSSLSLTVIPIAGPTRNLVLTATLVNQHNDIGAQTLYACV